jgi:DNA-binding response OmpR family regulator
MRILVVEDNERLNRNIGILLTRASYAVDTSTCGLEGLEKGLSGEYDCILLDWMLPDISGPEVLTSLRKQHIGTPILMLTARNMPHEVVGALDRGADDYLTKPFDSEVLLARIRAVIRRKTNKVETQVLSAGMLILDLAQREVTIGTTTVSLTPKEFSLLEYLLYCKNQTVPRMDLITHVWDENANLFSNMVDVYVSYLRKKLRPHKLDHLIETVKGVGYRICDD